MNSKEGSHELTKYNPIFKRITQSEEIYYKIDRKLVKILISQVIVTFISHSGDSKIGRGAMEQLTAGLKSSKYLDLKTNDDGKEIFKRDRLELEEAVNYFIDNINTVFGDALEDLLLEAAFKSIEKRTEKGTYILGLTEKEFFKRLLVARNKEQEERINARKAVGEKRIWVTEKIAELHKFCKENKEVIYKVKRDYKKCCSFKNWEETLKMKYPVLPDEIIKNLALTGRYAQPMQLVFQYAAIHFRSQPSTIEKIFYEHSRD